MNVFKFALLVLLSLMSFSVGHASSPARNTWLYVGGEYSFYSSTGFVTRKTATPTNLSLAISSRVHSDLWLGVAGFLGHDPSPDFSRNYDTSLGLVAHWLPFSNASSSTLFYEGMRLSESDTFRPFLSSKILFGRALLRRVLNNFEAGADFVGFNFGAGSHYVLTESISLSASIDYQKNLGLSPLPYAGQKTALSFGLLSAL